MKNILFLPSWFPGRTDPFSGDFIKRHAIGASLFNRVIVFHTAVDPSINKPAFVTEKINDNLSIHTFYYPPLKKFSAPVNGLRRFNALKKMYAEIFGKNKPDMVHAHVAYPAGLFALYLKKIKGIEFVLTEHNTIYMPAYDNSYTRSTFEKKIVPVIFKNAKKTVAVSAALANALKENRLVKEPVVIPNVVDTSVFKYKEKKAGEKTKFVHVSLLSNQKNPEGMLAAFARVKKQRNDFELTIVGPVNSKIKKMTGELSLKEHIRFTGEIPYERVADEIGNADAMIHFARFETFGCVVAEALCSGVPVIASDIDVLKELITDKQNGLLAKEADENDLAEKILFFMQRGFTPDSQKIATESQAKFNYQRVGKMLDELYQPVC
jgi:glycosyltransferase involved in cell wall biosynthesis